MAVSWQVYREMTHDDYRCAIDRLRMSQAAAGRFLGVSERTSRRYADGSSEIPVAASLLLHSMLAHDERPMVPKRSRRQY